MSLLRGTGATSRSARRGRRSGPCRLSRVRRARVVQRVSPAALRVTQAGSVCVACDDTVAVGAACGITRTDERIGGCASQERGVCLECVEAMFSVLRACADCDGARRCVDAEQHILCGDGALPVQSHCTPSTPQDALLVANNHAVKCSEAHFADGEACGDCPPSCVACADTSSCAVCAGGASLAQDGTCTPLENAAAQAHRGAVACDDAFVPDEDRRCVPCDHDFGDGCVSCSARECLACKEGFVLVGGACRRGDLCARADGTVCTACEDGTGRFNATDCVVAGDCAVYADGRCVQCVTPLVPLADGTCGELRDCLVAGQGVCLRCADGMFADESGGCQRLGDSTPHPQRATRRARRVRSTRRSAPRATRRPGRS